MELFGVGPLEVLLVVLLALVLFGPNDIAKNARTAGRFLNRLYKSEGWRTMTQASSALRNLPNRLAREAELDQLDQARREATGVDRPAAAPPAPTTPPAPGMTAWTPEGVKTSPSPPPPPPPSAADPD
jgi:Sec-independent protein translocase protein TatA